VTLKTIKKPGRRIMLLIVKNKMKEARKTKRKTAKEQIAKTILQ
jgi:hypothetical protein